jgi:CheY-like chemotaxis protein
VRRLVEMHGGTVEARSEGLKRGCEFVVRLPLAVPAIDSERVEQGPILASAGPLRVLVADDNVDAAESLSTMLKLLGNDVRVAHDGVQATEVAAEFHPDLILLDLGMPRLNGYDTCRSIRRQSWGKRPIIVALTGWGQEEAKRRSLDAGFDHHLVKPADASMLEALLQPGTVSHSV